MSKIPTTVVTGFLGAGKTTLVRHLLENANGRRIAVIVNEFGEIGVDAEILRGCGIETCGEEDIVELANGCICCTVADDFLPTMRKLIERSNPPEHILIETSGLALPKPLVKAFTWPEVRTRATVDGVVAMIDADAVASGRFAHDEAALAKARIADPSLDHDTPLEELFEDQIGCADIVVLNKTDLVDEAGLLEAERQIREHMRPGAKIIRARQGALDATFLLGLTIGAEDDLVSRHSHHDADEDHEHDDFESFAVKGGAVSDVAVFTSALSNILKSYDVLRMKGVIAVKNAPARLIVQAVGPRIQTYYDRPWRDGELRTSSLVVIGERGLERTPIETAVSGALT